MSDDSSWKPKDADEGGASEDETAPVDGVAGAGSEDITVAADESMRAAIDAELAADDGAGDDAGVGADGVVDEAQPEETLDESAHTKLCVYCVSEIDALATRCNRCSGYLPPAEGSDFKQHWTLLFCCVAIFIACIWLPIEGRRNDLYASHSIAGGFLAIFAGYGIFASWVNLFHRKMIVWPALFMALDGLFVSTRRLIQLINNVSAMENPTKEDWVRIGGPGLWVILFCSLLVFWTFMKGAAAGAKKDKERKEAARSARKR